MPNEMLRTYTGAVAAVTGAASGIGRGLADELARRGSMHMKSCPSLAKRTQDARGT